MRNILSILTCTLLVVLGACGSSETEVAPSDSAKTNTEATSQMADHEMGINREVHVDPEIADDWSGAIIRITDIESGAVDEFDVTLGKKQVLGDSGIQVEAILFVPDFSMDEDGISSSSAEPENPALQVVITDDEQGVYEGWLFAKVPEIHAYQHPNYSITLIEGIPAS